MEEVRSLHASFFSGTGMLPYQTGSQTKKLLNKQCLKGVGEGKLWKFFSKIAKIIRVKVVVLVPESQNRLRPQIRMLLQD